MAKPTLPNATPKPKSLYEEIQHSREPFKVLCDRIEALEKAIAKSKPEKK